MSSILHSLAGLPAPAAYALVGGLAFGEAVFLLGFILPGETAVVLGGVIASQGRVSLPVMIAVVAAGAVLGDSLSYEIGRRFGPALLSRPSLRRRERTVHSVERLMTRWGAWIVVAGRVTAYIRPVVPALAGAAGMRYRSFLVANAAGGIAWAAAFTALGYGLGDAYTKATGAAHWGGLGLLVLGAAAAIAVHWWHRRMKRHPTSASPRQAHEEPNRDMAPTEMAGVGDRPDGKGGGHRSQAGQSGTVRRPAPSPTRQDPRPLAGRSSLPLAAEPSPPIRSNR